MKLKYISILMICIGLASCRTWDENYNIDPNRPNAEVPSYPDDHLVAMIDGTRNYAIPASDVMSAVCGYDGKLLSLSQGNKHASWHDLDGNIWKVTYQSLQSIKNLRNAAKKLGHANLEAIADIWQCYIFMTMTNMSGHIPYFDVIGDGAVNLAKYDKQQDIYADILTKLEVASDHITTDGSNPVSKIKDYIYFGDMIKWKKWANSMRLKMAMYMYNADPVKAKAIALQITGNPVKYPIFSSNEDNFAIHYDGVERKSVWYNTSGSSDVPQIISNKHRLSNVFVERLISLKDARLVRYAYPVRKVQTDASKYVLPINAGPNKYLGQLYGITTGDGDAKLWNGIDAKNEGREYASQVGPTFFLFKDGKDGINGSADMDDRTASKPYVISSYSEISFILAEMCYRGIITGNAEQYYKQAIKASFEMHNCKWNGDPDYDGAFKGGSEIGLVGADAYIAQKSVDWNGGRDKMLLLAEQMWLSYYMMGFEPYWTYRRLMLPKLSISSKVADFAVQGSGMFFPSRTAYPDSEGVENKVNYDLAHATLYDIPITGGNNRNLAKMWLLNNAASPSLDMTANKYIEPMIKSNEYPGQANFSTWYTNNWNTMMWWKKEAI